MKHHHARFRGCIAFVLVWLVALCQGCKWKLEPDKLEPQQAPQATVWHIAPVSMRIYPSTRFNIGQKLLEAQIEFLDQMNDSVKAIGSLRLQLFKPGRTGAGSVGRLLYTWDVSMLTLKKQWSHYNTITNAYLFQLKVDHLPKKLQRTVLHAAFRGQDGSRLEAKAPVPIKRHGHEDEPVAE